jgi:hypothetical protein
MLATSITCWDGQKARCISRLQVLFKSSAGAEPTGAATFQWRLAIAPPIGAVLRGDNSGCLPYLERAPKRSHLFALRAAKISAYNQPSDWLPNERVANEPVLAGPELL